jgi:hypothetical protein
MSSAIYRFGPFVLNVSERLLLRNTTVAAFPLTCSLYLCYSMFVRRERRRRRSLAATHQTAGETEPSEKASTQMHLRALVPSTDTRHPDSIRVSGERLPRINAD